MKETLAQNEVSSEHANIYCIFSHANKRKILTQKQLLLLNIFHYHFIPAQMIYKLLRSFSLFSVIFTSSIVFFRSFCIRSSTNNASSSISMSFCQWFVFKYSLPSFYFHTLVFIVCFYLTNNNNNNGQQIHSNKKYRNDTRKKSVLNILCLGSFAWLSPSVFCIIPFLVQHSFFSSVSFLFVTRIFVSFISYGSQ